MPYKPSLHQATLLDKADDFIETVTLFQVAEEEWTVSAHFFGVPGHYLKGGPHQWGQIGLIDNQQVRFGYARSSFAGDFLTGCDVDDVERKVCQFGAEGGGQVVAATLHKDDVQEGKGSGQPGYGFQVDGCILPDGGMGTAAGFHAVRVKLSAWSR